MQEPQRIVSDEELDKEWSPNPRRPQSTMARNFSAALDDLFRIDGGLDDLSKNVFEKKQAVTTQTTELEALEARLKAAEERLKRAGNSPKSKTGGGQNSRRSPLAGTFAEAGQDHPTASGNNSNDEAPSAQQQPQQTPPPTST